MHLIRSSVTTLLSALLCAGIGSCSKGSNDPAQSAALGQESSLGQITSDLFFYSSNGIQQVTLRDAALAVETLGTSDVREAKRVLAGDYDPTSKSYANVHTDQMIWISQTSFNQAAIFTSPLAIGSQFASARVSSENNLALFETTHKFSTRLCATQFFNDLISPGASVFFYSKTGSDYKCDVMMYMGGDDVRYVKPDYPVTQAPTLVDTSNGAPQMIGPITDPQTGRLAGWLLLKSAALYFSASPDMPGNTLPPITSPVVSVTLGSNAPDGAKLVGYHDGSLFNIAKFDAGSKTLLSPLIASLPISAGTSVAMFSDGIDLYLTTSDFTTATHQYYKVPLASAPATPELLNEDTQSELYAGLSENYFVYNTGLKIVAINKSTKQVITVDVAQSKIIALSFDTVFYNLESAKQAVAMKISDTGVSTRSYDGSRWVAKQSTPRYALIPAPPLPRRLLLAKGIQTGVAGANLFSVDAQDSEQQILLGTLDSDVTTIETAMNATKTLLQVQTLPLPNNPISPDNVPRSDIYYFDYESAGSLHRLTTTPEISESILQ